MPASRGGRRPPLDWQVRRAREKAAMRQVLRLDLDRLTTTDLAAPWLIRPVLWPDGSIGGWEVCWQGLRADRYPDIYPSRDAAFLALVGEGPTSRHG